MNRRLAWMIAIGLAVAWNLVARYQPPTLTADPPPTVASTPIPRVAPPILAAGTDAVQAIASQPLFFPTRQPWIAPTAVAASTPIASTPPPFTLVGTWRGAAQGAHLRESGSQHVRRVTLGATVEGWTVSALTAESITLAGPGGTHTLRLLRGTERTSVAATAPVAPGPAATPPSSGPGAASASPSPGPLAGALSEKSDEELRAMLRDLNQKMQTAASPNAATPP